ncbi:MAG: flagellar filament capping protein FliD [Synergistaceae bacterium]|jgi:flagellar capping protein FliD|nr:flagellar filament capping protein FliD [Synergistaceae bacterium]
MASDSLFQITGVSSGIGWDEIISKIVENGKKPATNWQNQIDSLEVKKTLYQDLQSQFNTLRNTLTKLRLSSAYNTKKAEYTSYSSNNVDPSKIVSATINNSAELSWWDIEVKNLARAQRHMSSRVPSVSEALGLEGDFMIRVGKQYATISVSSTDALRDINYNISKAVDQNGQPLAVTAKLLDNRLVIESAVAGKGNSGDTRGVDFTMTKASEYYLPHASARGDDGKYAYPPQLLNLYREDTNVDGSTYTYKYIEGTDFTYDSSNGKITWLSGGQKPPEGTTFNAIYSEWITVKRNDATGLPPLDTANFGANHENYDYLPDLPTGKSYPITADTTDAVTAGYFTIICEGVEYREGLDFTIVTKKLTNPVTNQLEDYDLIQWNDGDTDASDDDIGKAYGDNVQDPDYPNDPTKTYTLKTPPGTDKTLSVRVGANTGYTYDENVFYLEPVITGSDDAEKEQSRKDGYSTGSVLAGLGFITPAANGSPADEWTFTEGNYTNASNAEFEIDGVPVTRDSNTIDDLIADVTLELTGLGQVRINIVRDIEETVENMQSFVDAYNSVLEWINFYVSEKADGANAVDETDHLSSLLEQSKGNTVYGALHGDQLLWTIKNQLRKRLSNPITTLASSLATKSVVNTADAMSIKGSFYIYTAGKAARIDIEPSDSLEDIQKKLTGADNSFSPDGSKAKGGGMGLSVSMVNGQLIIDSPQSSSSSALSAPATTSTLSDKITRGSESYDYLPFFPETSPPINGTFRVYSGSKEYQEGTDFQLITENKKDADGNSIMTGRIEWYDGKAPESSYYVDYDYTPGAVSYSFIDDEDAAPTPSEIAKGLNGLSSLGLHYDASKLTLTKLGITTESLDYGKSGYIEFNSESFIAMMESDPDIAGGSMLSFMRDFDTYIGNLVDSSQTLVAGQIVTKGRIATALNTIDSQQTTLNDRITKLNKQLEDKQTALYKRYSDMEVAIQKMNAQMSSLSSYLSNMSSS